MILRTPATALSTATVAVLLLAACGAPPTATDKAAEAAAAQAEPSPLTQQPVSAPIAAPAMPVIATGAGPEGTQVSLVKAKVTGNVLTVELSYRTPDQGTKWDSFYFDAAQVSVIDDTTSQRYGVLKDNTDAWMASPIDTDGKRLRVQTNNGKPSVVWFKFPAPPATSPTVSINIPNVSPFDGVTVQR